MTRRQENKGFTCVRCGVFTPPVQRGTIRDHCRWCLHSIHVDVIPGDRASMCHGVLRPQSIDFSGKKGHVIVYSCSSCGAVKRNRAADDDSLDAILEVQRSQAARLFR